ncbi:hypothetical protein WR25_14745 [Diploscapter pachys]|uniref:Uncharacterized protein n=1 Tax=Diploscapter pachys TaxID=2018661 RepID=A0A2A2JN40_9BILA|nr:hypothetical protein WR25_14745 [Diploscapter pachys]
MQNLTREDPLNEVQQKWVNGEIPVVATIAFGMGIDKANAKKGLSDYAKDNQIKALQTGIEKMIENYEKAECRHKLMASFFNESDLKECVEEVRFLQNSRAGQPTGKCAQNGKRKKKRNILDSRMEKEEARCEVIVRTVIQALDDNSSQTDKQMTSNTTPAICSPRHSAPTTTRLHSLEYNQGRDKEWNGIRLLFCFSHLIMIKLR